MFGRCRKVQMDLVKKKSFGAFGDCKCFKTHSHSYNPWAYIRLWCPWEVRMYAWAPFKYLYYLCCFHAFTLIQHLCLILSVLVITLLPLSSILLAIVIALYGWARGDFSMERLLFVCRCDEQFCFTIFFLGTSPPSTVWSKVHCNAILVAKTCVK